MAKSRSDIDWDKVVKHMKATCKIIADNCADGTFDPAKKMPVAEILHGIATAIEAGRRG